MQEALAWKGFSVIEIISPCPTYYGRWNKMGTALDQMKYYHDSRAVRHGAPTHETDIGLGDEIVVGCFVREPKPTIGDLLRAQRS